MGHPSPLALNSRWLRPRQALMLAWIWTLNFVVRLAHIHTLTIMAEGKGN